MRSWVVLSLAAIGMLCATAVQAQEVALGVIAPLTGIRSDGGVAIQRAVELAQEAIAASSSSKIRFRPIFEDSQYDAKTALSALIKLKDLDRVRYVLGPYGSSEVMAVAPVTEKEGMLLLVPGAQSEDITDAGELIFRFAHNSRQEAPLFGEFIAKRMKGASLPVLAGQTALTPPYLKRMAAALAVSGKRLGRVIDFDFRASDFRAQLLQLMSDKPTDILMIATPHNAGYILKQAHELGIQTQWYNIGVEGPEMVQIGGRGAEGLLYPYSYDSQSIDKKVKAFRDLYVSRYAIEPDTLAANTYDALLLLQSCFTQVGIAVPAVRDCLYGVHDYSGASGRFSIDAKGDAQKELVVKTVRDGQLVVFEKLTESPHQ